jgi:hypothetical protein
VIAEPLTFPPRLLNNTGDDDDRLTQPSVIVRAPFDPNAAK